MVPYIALYALILLFPFVGNLVHDKTKHKREYCILIFGAILFLVGLRHPSMGNDLVGYLNSYRRLHAMPWGKVVALDSYLNYEKGYILFTKLIATLTFGNEQFFLFICAMIATIPVGYTIYKKSQNVLLSTVIYLGLPIFLLQYSALRQGIALGLCFYTINLIEEKKLWRFLLVTFVATCFHYSSVVFILAYFVYHLRISGNVRWILTALFPIVFAFRQPLFSVLSRLLKNDAVAIQTNAMALMLVFMLIYIFLLLIFYRDDDARANGYMNLFFCACLCQIFSGVYATAIRVGYYFMIVLVLLLPMAISKIEDKRQAWLVRGAIVVCFVLFAFDSIIGSSWAKAYPYYTFWQTISF